MKNILILGHGDHGKTTVAKHIANTHGFTFKDSSEFACEHAVFPVLSGKYGYKTPAECHAGRRNHRVEWGDLIAGYNLHDPTRLAREMLRTNDMYVGMRRWRELIPCLKCGLFSDVIWIDATGRKPQEPYTSMELDYRSVEGICKVWNVKISFISNQGEESGLSLQLDRLSF